MGDIFDQLNRYPVLPQSEVRELIAIAQSGGKKALWARQKIIRHNMRLVAQSANRYKANCRFLDVEELVSEGVFGLNRAIDKFKLDTGFQFSTYAKCWIDSAIQRAWRNQDRTIRLSSHCFDYHSEVCKVAKAIRKETDKNPSTAQIAARMEKPVEWVERYIRNPDAPASLDARLGHDTDNDPLSALIAADGLSPIELAIANERRELVRAAIAKLDDRSAEAIKSYYGLDGHEALTNKQIGDRFGVTHQRASDIKRSAQKRLKKLLELVNV